MGCVSNRKDNTVNTIKQTVAKIPIQSKKFIN